MDLRGFLSFGKADDAGLPAQAREDNTTERQKDRKDRNEFIRKQY